MSIVIFAPKRIANFRKGLLGEKLESLRTTLQHLFIQKFSLNRRVQVGIAHLNEQFVLPNGMSYTV